MVIYVEYLRFSHVNVSVMSVKRIFCQVIKKLFIVFSDESRFNLSIIMEVYMLDATVPEVTVDSIKEEEEKEEEGEEECFPIYSNRKHSDYNSVVEQVSSRDSHELDCYLMNQNSGFLRMHGLLYKDLTVFLCAPIYFYSCNYKNINTKIITVVY